MGKFKTIKEVLENTYKLIENENNTFTCTAIESFDNGRMASSELIIQTKGFFETNKPTEELHPEFFNHKSFNGEFVWWNFTKGQKRYYKNLPEHGRRKYDKKLNKALREERLRFLKMLISIA